MSNVDIPEDQAFYLTDEGVVIYFGVDEIAPKEFGIPKFTMEYKKFAPYINPRFYCTPENIYTTMRLRSNSEDSIKDKGIKHFIFLLFSSIFYSLRFFLI